MSSTKILWRCSKCITVQHLYSRLDATRVSAKDRGLQTPILRFMTNSPCLRVFVVCFFSLCLFRMVVLFPSEPTVEKHLKHLRQLTSGGENAEAYFSFDGKQLIFQSTRG